MLLYQAPTGPLEAIDFHAVLVDLAFAAQSCPREMARGVSPSRHQTTTIGQRRNASRQIRAANKKRNAECHTGIGIAAVIARPGLFASGLPIRKAAVESFARIRAAKGMISVWCLFAIGDGLPVIAAHNFRFRGHT